MTRTIRTAADARRLFNDDLDELITHSTGTTLELLLSERSRRIGIQADRLAAIDALWVEFGIDAEDIRRPNGSMSYRHVRTSACFDAMRVVGHQAERQTGNARTRRYHGGMGNAQASTPEGALLVALRAGFVSPPQ